jgi:hypothetical protein
MRQLDSADLARYPASVSEKLVRLGEKCLLSLAGAKRDICRSGREIAPPLS